MVAETNRYGNQKKADWIDTTAEEILSILLHMLQFSSVSHLRVRMSEGAGSTNMQSITLGHVLSNHAWMNIYRSADRELCPLEKRTQLMTHSNIYYYNLQFSYFLYGTRWRKFKDSQNVKYYKIKVKNVRAQARNWTFERARDVNNARSLIAYKNSLKKNFHGPRHL